MRYLVQKNFSAAHYYRQAQWSEEKNRETFGKCFRPFGHGHDYTLQIELETSDFPSACASIDALIETLDHHHLNLSIGEFKTEIPTTENLANYLQKKLLSALEISKSRLHFLRLYENPEIWVELTNF